MNWTREDFEQDKARYEAELAALLEGGYAEGHPLINRVRRRILVVDRVLADPAFGLTEPPQEKP